MRRIVITGASVGLGAALARHYAAPGTVIGLIARRQEPMQALASGLPGRFEVHALDVADHAALAHAAQEFCARHGAPDLVIANAGISVGTHGEDGADVAKLQRVLEVNVTGLAATLAAFAPAMRAARGGTLCGIASVAAFRGLPGAGAYSASKSAAIRWLEALRVELVGTGVSVVTICPGYIDTPMTRVNRYRMPFLLSADEAARRIGRAIGARRRLAVIPWQMALVSSVLRVLPGWLYDRIAARAPRKPRDLPL
ncbi:MAG: SDR family oxidoreductase [Betaproteobacteria bacterium]|nr:SDR family oxidoreductase [Betaproteobacteria bacterium]